MSSEKTLRSYIMPGVSRRLLAWMLTLLVLAAGGMLGYSKYSAYTDPDPAVRYDKKESDEDTYVYVDVVGVTNWLYRSREMYYCVIDKNGEAYIAKLEDDVFEQMDEQNKYMLGIGSDEAPEPYRIYGSVRKIQPETKDGIERALDMESIDYYSAFGFNYIDTGVTPVDTAGRGWGTVLFASVLVWLLLGLPCFRACGNARKCIRRLNALGALDAAAAELGDEKTARYGEDYMRLSANFYYGNESGVVLRCDDVLYAYKFTHRARFRTVSENLMLGTKTCGILKATNIRQDEYIAVDRVAYTFAERNPSVLVGNSAVNNEMYLNMVKQLKKAGK